MYFLHLNDKCIHTNIRFINKPKTVVGSVAPIRFGDLEVPAVSSATDSRLNVSLCKLFSEFLERNIIGVHYKSQKTLLTYDLLNCKLEYLQASDFSYGEKGKFNCVDTTGSAAGKTSYDVINKAISELIEKNELFLFWYCRKGKLIENNSFIQDILLKYGLAEFENFLFISNNLSNWPTIIYISFNNTELVTTGICCDKKLSKAIEGAICEGKTLRVLEVLRGLNIKTELDVYNFIRNYSSVGEMMNQNLKRTLIHDLMIADWIDDLYISLFDSSIRGKVVTVSSNSLIKCIPNNENLVFCRDTYIVKKNIVDFSRLTEVDCIIL
ncbi:TPA: YcaO-like family protein [Streptococcus suis]|nr:YcaO-like family protein [Streptococcus suis]